MYTYKMVQVPPGISVTAKGNDQNAAADYLQKTVNTHAQDGWEFQRIDTLSVHVQPGCFAALFGNRGETNNYYVITFRRLISDVG